MSPAAIALLSLAFAAAAGLALGSYAVTAGVRLARAEPSSAGRSHCDGCGVELGFRQTIPIISYWRSGGVCASCGGRIDPIHLAGEVAGLIVVVSAVLLGDPLRAMLVAAVGLLLIGASATDWRVFRLPDAITAAIAIACVALAATRSAEQLIAGLAMAALLGGALQTMRFVRRRAGRDPGLGFGDVKLVAALAIWLGLAGQWMVVGASMIGLLMARLGRPDVQKLAFGPAIAGAGWIIGMGGEAGWWPTTI